MNEKRIYYFDILKCIASYLICLSHFGTLDTDIVHRPHYSVYFNYFFQGISSVGVPIFLMVNGAFLMNKDYPLNKVFYRAKSYVILYLVWGAITLLILAPFFHDQYNFRSFLLAVLHIKLERTDHLWFLLAMTYIYLLFPLFKALYDKAEKVYTVYLVVLIFVCTFGYVFVNEVANTSGFFLHSVTLKQMNINYFFSFNPFDKWYAYTLVYFICGGLISKNVRNVGYKTPVLVLFILIPLILLFFFGLVKSHTITKEYDSVWGGHDSIMTFSMSIAFFILCSRIDLANEKVIESTRVIGLNTLGIYFIHIPLGVWLTDYYESFSISDYFVADLIYAFLLMMASLCISICLKKIPVVNRLVKI